MKNVFDAAGDLREVDPLAALVTCWRDKASGELRFERAASQCGFDLEGGEVVGVISSDPRFETAAILVRAGKLAADAVERLAPQGGDPAALALQTGLLTRREWKWGEKIRAIEVLSDLLSWEGGQYRFDTAASPRGGDFRLPVPRLLLELFLRSRDRDLIDHQLGAVDQRLVRGELFETEFPTFGLTADAESVVHLIDGRSTAIEIAEKAPAEEFAVRKLLAALVTLGLVHPVPGPPPRPVERPVESAPPASELGETEPEPLLPPAFPRDEAAPEETVQLEIPERPSEEMVDVAFPEAVSAAESEPPAMDLPGESPSPLDRFEPSRPASPWEEEAPPPPPERWESPEVFPAPMEEPEPAEPPRRLGAPFVWGLGILVAAVVAVVLWRSRAPAPPPAPGTTAARPTSAPAVVTFPPPITAARIEARETAASPAGAPAAVTSAEAARRVSAVAIAKPAPATPRPSTAAVEPPGEGRSAWLKRAERDRKRLESDRKTHYSIQLELVCEVPSLTEAWRHDRGGTMWLTTVSHGGRECFRVFWGRYPTLDAARKGKSSVPSYFVTARNHPAVVAVP